MVEPLLANPPRKKRIAGEKNLGSVRPSLKDIHDHVVIGAADKWKGLGVQLLPQSGQEQLLQVIGTDHPHDAISCCKRVLEKWLDTSDATWNQLIRALRNPSIQLDYLADQLEQMMIIECSTESVSEMLTDILDNEIQFTKMMNAIRQALIKSNVDVFSLIERLCAVSSVKNKIVPLFDESIFEEMKSIDEFWGKLESFWSIFGHELLQCIVDISECEEAQIILEKFLSRFDFSAIKDVDLALHCGLEDLEGALRPVLRVKINTEKCTLSVKNNVEEIVSKIYNLNECAACFQGIIEGCNELVYYVSNPLKLYLLQFKVSKGDLAEFLAHKVISLNIDQFELQTKATDRMNETVTWLVHAPENNTMPGVHINLSTVYHAASIKACCTYTGLTSKHRGVAVIIGNSYTRKGISLTRQLPPLPSSLVDVYKLNKVFEYLQFYTVVKCNVTLSRFLESVLFPLALSFSTSPHFVFTFCGHGGDDFVYCEDEKCIKFSDIIKFISNYTSLKSVPRLFFFDVSRNAETISCKENENFGSQISGIGNVFVAFSTSTGHQSLECNEGSLWISLLANKLITCAKDMHEVVMEANEELVTAIQSRGISYSQQPELFDKLTTTVNLLSELDSRREQSKIKVDFDFLELLKLPDSNSFIKMKESPQTFHNPSVEVPNSEMGKESHRQSDDSVDGRYRKSSGATTSNGLPTHKTQMKIGCYILGETLGHGTFGKVKVAKHEFTGHQVAVKILNKHKIKDLRMAQKLQREIQILKLLHHPHVIKLYEVIPTATDIFLILEYVAGGELYDYIIQHGKLAEKEARFFFQQIIAGVAYCHKHKVVHRDLKPENILLDCNNQVKIADFGLSNIIKDGELLNTSCGSPNYAAPEVVSRELYAGPEVDIWSCGIILFAMLCAYLPFDDESVAVLFKKIRLGHFKIPMYLSLEVVDLIKSMLQVEPVNRITVQQIKDHEWFLQDLPEDLFPQCDEDCTSDTIDPVVINEVCQKLGVKMEEVVTAVENGDPHDQLHVAYHLVLDNTTRAHPEMMSPKPAEMSHTNMPGEKLSPIKNPHKSPKPQWPLYTSYSVHAPRLYPAGFKRSRWHLGIQSQSHPLNIMAGVFYKMKKLNFCWKNLTPYHVLVKYNMPNKENLTIKLDLQLYQIDQRNYLLDLKNVMPSLSENSNTEGDFYEKCDSEDEFRNVPSQRHCTMEFFEITSMLLKALIS